METGLVLVLLTWSVLAAYLRYRRHHRALDQWWQKSPTSLKRRVEEDA